MKHLLFCFLFLISLRVEGGACKSKESLFSTPSFISAKLSPDGKQIAFVGADSTGVTNVFLLSTEDLFPKEIEEASPPENEMGANEEGEIDTIDLEGAQEERGFSLSEATQLTSFKTPEIVQFFWAADGKKILLLKDEDGAARLDLLSVDLTSKEVVSHLKKFSKVELTPLIIEPRIAYQPQYIKKLIPPQSAKIIQVSTKKNAAVIGVYHDSSYCDLHLLDLDSGAVEPFYKNEGFAKFLVSNSLDLIFKTKIHDDGSWTVFKADGEVFMELSPLDAMHTEILSYDEKSDSVCLLDTRQSNTNQLGMKPLNAALPHRVMGAQALSDIDEVVLVNGEPAAYASYYTQKKWHVADLAVAKDIPFLEEKIGGDFSVVSQSQDSRVWIVSTCLPDQGSRFWVYERSKRELAPLYTSDGNEFAKMYPIIVEARDGEKLVCYYTLPKELDLEGRLDAPIPLVVVPHGGPFKIRDRFEFCPYHQWLASRGYAVLSVNFRLSSGFGKRFVEAGDGEWGGKAHFDVIDAVEACIEQGIAERGKVAVFGGSYGGYEALASLAFTPDYFACAVAVCGPSNLKTCLDSLPEFWEISVQPFSDRTHFFTKNAFVKSMGDNLEKSSPYMHVDEIRKPLLIGHGSNDHIVKEFESHQIYERMKARGMNVKSIIFPDEGHGFAKNANQLKFLNEAERFLSQYLGGKFEELDENLTADSSASIFE